MKYGGRTTLNHLNETLKENCVVQQKYTTQDTTQYSYSFMRNTTCITTHPIRNIAQHVPQLLFSGVNKRQTMLGCEHNQLFISTILIVRLILGVSGRIPFSKWYVEVISGVLKHPWLRQINYWKETNVQVKSLLHNSL